MFSATLERTKHDIYSKQATRGFGVRTTFVSVANRPHTAHTMRVQELKGLPWVGWAEMHPFDLHISKICRDNDQTPILCSCRYPNSNTRSETARIACLVIDLYIVIAPDRHTHLSWLETNPELVCDSNSRGCSRAHTTQAQTTKHRVCQKQNRESRIFGTADLFCRGHGAVKCHCWLLAVRTFMWVHITAALICSRMVWSTLQIHLIQHTTYHNRQYCKYTPQPPPIAEFAAGNLSAENPPEKLRRAELAAEFC